MTTSYYCYRMRDYLAQMLRAGLLHTTVEILGRSILRSHTGHNQEPGPGHMIFLPRRSSDHRPLPSGSCEGVPPETPLEAPCGRRVLPVDLASLDSATSIYIQYVAQRLSMAMFNLWVSGVVLQYYLI